MRSRLFIAVLCLSMLTGIAYYVGHDSAYATSDERYVQMLHDQCVFGPHAWGDITCKEPYTIRGSSIMQKLNALDFRLFDSQDSTTTLRSSFQLRALRQALEHLDKKIDKKKLGMTPGKTLLGLEIIQYYMDYWYDRIAQRLVDEASAYRIEDGRLYYHSNQVYGDEVKDGCPTQSDQIIMGELVVSLDEIMAENTEYLLVASTREHCEAGSVKGVYLIDKKTHKANRILYGNEFLYEYRYTSGSDIFLYVYEGRILGGKKGTIYPRGYLSEYECPECGLRLVEQITLSIDDLKKYVGYDDPDTQDYDLFPASK